MPMLMTTTYIYSWDAPVYENLTVNEEMLNNIKHVFSDLNSFTILLYDTPGTELSLSKLYYPKKQKSLSSYPPPVFHNHQMTLTTNVSMLVREASFKSWLLGVRKRNLCILTISFQKKRSLILLILQVNRTGQLTKITSLPDRQACTVCVNKFVKLEVSQ